MSSIIILKEKDQYIVAEETQRTDISGIEHCLEARNDLRDVDGIDLEMIMVTEKNVLSKEEIKRLIKKIGPEQK